MTDDRCEGCGGEQTPPTWAAAALVGVIWRFTCRDCDRRAEDSTWGWTAFTASVHGQSFGHAAQVEAVFREATTPLGYTRRAWRGRPGPPRRV